MHRDEAGERGDEGAERKMSKTAGDGEASRRLVQSSTGRGGMTTMGAARENAVFSFFS